MFLLEREALRQEAAEMAHLATGFSRLLGSQLRAQVDEEHQRVFAKSQSQFVSILSMPILETISFDQSQVVQIPLPVLFLPP